MEIHVVTRVGPYPGNHSTMIDADIWVDGQLGRRGSDRKVDHIQLLALRMPVFYVGEILILADGREPHGKGRKPAKWNVDTQEVEDLDEAVALSRELVDAELARLIQETRRG